MVLRHVFFQVKETIERVKHLVFFRRDKYLLKRKKEEKYIVFLTQDSIN